MSTARTTVTASPATAYKIVAVPELYQDVILRHGMPGAAVGSTEQENPWIRFGDDAAIRHLALGIRGNCFGNIDQIIRMPRHG
jgi:2,4'-dihydroxyacetophenone dioxygenase